MGEASMERAATPDETAQIKALLGEAIDAGAFGFSTTILNQHLGYQGRPLACRNASRDEYKAYANALKERGKGAIEIALTRKIAVMDDEEYELLDFLLRESGQHVTFLALFDRDDIPEAVRDTLRNAPPLIARGARPQTSPLPLTRDINMRNPFSFAAFPSWNRVFVDKSKPAQAAVYADPAFRNQFREELKRPMAFGNWERINVHEVQSPALKALEGRSVADIAREQGKDGVDAFLDLTLKDDLDVEFTMASFNTRVDRMAEILNDKSVLVALGDGGAHVDMLCDAGYPTYLLGTWVRERQALTLEEGVRRLTSDPAEVFGVRNRGRLAPGLAADVAVFDAARIGSTNRGERRFDLPGGAKRMVMPSRGVEYTVVNGVVTWADGKLTGATAAAAPPRTATFAISTSCAPGISITSRAASSPSRRLSSCSATSSSIRPPAPSARRWRSGSATSTSRRASRSPFRQPRDARPRRSASNGRSRRPSAGLGRAATRASSTGCSIAWNRTR